MVSGARQKNPQTAERLLGCQESPMPAKLGTPVMVFGVDKPRGHTSLGEIFQAFTEFLFVKVLVEFNNKVIIITHGDFLLVIDSRY